MTAGVGMSDTTRVLDLTLYDRIRLRSKPPVQRLIEDWFLRFDYRKLDLRVEGLERIPPRPVVYAMNHTDNFNYWPFQYYLHRERERYTATWVKGKNWEDVATATFMRLTNNIPIASRGYLITRDFLNVMGRRPEPEEYRALRDAVDDGQPVSGPVPEAVLQKPRDMMGHRFDPTRERWSAALRGVLAEMNRRFVRLNEQAHWMGLDILVFPQGTRSVRLSRGHIGLAELVLHLGATLVPVGCNGSDLVYTGRSLRSEPGRIVYRIGEPMYPDDFADIAPRVPFVPFTSEAEAAHRDAFQEVVDRVMLRIDGLVDERHRFSTDLASDGTRGTDRFL